METNTEKNIYSYYELKTCPKDPSTQILIRSFTKEDLIETASFIGRTQVELHPFFINLNESIEYVTDFYKNLLPALIDDDLSVVAIYNSKIIGFIGGNDYCPKGKPDTYGLLTEKFPALCEQGSAVFMAEKNVEEFKKPDDFGRIAFVSALVVDKNFNGKGIGTLLFDFINYHPKLSKFPIVLTEIAAFASKIISQKLGFVTVHTEKWENLKTPEGKYPYKGILEKLERKGLGKENDFYSFCILKR